MTPTSQSTRRPPSSEEQKSQKAKRRQELRAAKGKDEAARRRDEAASDKALEAYKKAIWSLRNRRAYCLRKGGDDVDAALVDDLSRELKELTANKDSFIAQKKNEYLLNMMENTEPL